MRAHDSVRASHSIIFLGVPSLEFACTLASTVSPLSKVACFLPLFLRSRWHCFLSLFRMARVSRCSSGRDIVDLVCWKAMCPVLEDGGFLSGLFCGSMGNGNSWAFVAKDLTVLVPLIGLAFQVWRAKRVPIVH